LLSVPAAATALRSPATAAALEEVASEDFFASLVLFIQHFAEPALHDLVEYAQHPPAFVFAPSSLFTFSVAVDFFSEDTDDWADAEIINAQKTRENINASFFIMLGVFLFRYQSYF
jgi:hypothetical protein